MSLKEAFILYDKVSDFDYIERLKNFSLDCVLCATCSFNHKGRKNV